MREAGLSIVILIVVIVISCMAVFLPDDAIWGQYLLFLFGLTGLWIFVIPSVGLVAIKELPVETKVLPTCSKMSKFTWWCQWANIIVLVSYICFTMVTLSGGSSREGLNPNTGAVIFCSALTVIIVANASSIFMNIFLLAKYRHTSLLLAMLSQICLCFGIYFIGRKFLELAASV
jgi:hypothetical protein